MADDLKQWVINLIEDYVNNSQENRLTRFSEKVWESPIIGFSNGSDSLFGKIKKDIGDFFWTPMEAFLLSFPDTRVSDEELTVICWVLPQTEQTKKDNKKQKEYPSERWVHSRIYGEEFNNKIAKHTAKTLNDAGYQTMVPVLSAQHRNNYNSVRYGYASSWSERHACFVSGLGTFGLCDALITAKGKAIRCGSVISKINIDPDERQYKSHNEYCLYYSTGSCMKCAQRCPADAITSKGHDKIKCRTYQREKIAAFTMENYNLQSICCGLCQTGTPCESGIPLK